MSSLLCSVLWSGSCCITYCAHKEVDEISYCEASSGKEVNEFPSCAVSSNEEIEDFLTVEPPRDGSRWLPCFGAASGKTPRPQFAQTITKSFTEPSRNLHGLQQSFFEDYLPFSPSPCMSYLSEPPLVRKSKNSLLLSLLRDGSRLLGRGCGGELRAAT